MNREPLSRRPDAPRPRGPKGLVPAERLFQGLVGKLGYNPEVYAVFEVWDRLLGEREAKRYRAVGIKAGRLYVETDSNAHLHDFSLRKRTILKNLNGHFRTRPPISDIILKLSPRRKQDINGKE